MLLFCNEYFRKTYKKNKLKDINLNNYNYSENNSVFLVKANCVDLGNRTCHKETEGLVPERAENILLAIFNNTELPPIEVIKLENPSLHKYRLHDGYHRANISIFLNFPSLPVKINEDAQKIYNEDCKKEEDYKKNNIKNLD